MFISLRLPGARQAPELALLSATVRASVAGEAAGCGSGDQRARRGQSSVLRIPADSRPAQTPGAGLWSQDGMAHHAPTWVVSDRSAPASAIGAAARGARAGGRTQPAVGLGHHGHPGVGWTEGALSDHDRLCGPDGVGVALRQADYVQDLAEMLREAVFQRFGETRTRAQGIEFLSDNGPEYTSHRVRPFVRAMGLIPCHTPRRSPESNGLAEAFFGSLKRDTCTRRAWRPWRRWRTRCPSGSSTTISTPRTARWGCRHQPSSMRSG
jgi:transposase InsO family protein